jgi:acid phosphatase (class A)
MPRLLPSLLLAVAAALAGCQTPPPRASTRPAPAIQPATSNPPTSDPRPAVKPEAAPRFLTADAVDRLESALPDPPPDRGPIARGEGDLVLALQAQATPEARARAKSEEDFRVWAFADVLGPDFTKDKLVLTEALMRQAERDSAVVTRALKGRWDRKRPPLQDDRIAAAVGIPKDGSYPSGHATRAMLWAHLLAILAPEKEQELLQRARLVAYDRVIGGVHYPTDVAAGMTMGGLIADEIAKSPEFQSELRKAREEFDGVMRAEKKEPQPAK